MIEGKGQEHGCHNFKQFKSHLEKSKRVNGKDVVKNG